MQYPISTLMSKKSLAKHIFMGICLLLALYIYTAYRSEDVYVNQIVQMLWPQYNGAESFHLISLPDWCIYSLPEALWIIALSIASHPLYITLFQFRISLQFVIPIIIISFEILQYFQILNGTFDLMDIVIPGVAWVLVLLLTKRAFATKIALSDFTFLTWRWLGLYCIVLLAHYAG